MEIPVNASRAYLVTIGRGILAQVGAQVRAKVGGSKVCIVSDDHVAPLYEGVVKESLEQAGYAVTSFVFPHGEESKSAETLLQLLSFLATSRLTRSDCLVALGGGVVGDLTGFAASCYLRGIPFVQVPTTVLAAVDSSVGGKTAIDLPEGKNLVGAFYQPHLVWCDIETFQTLPAATVEDGFAEIIKYGMLGNDRLMELLKLDVTEHMEEIVGLCVAMKRDVVNEDEFDHGTRQLLNLGHTVGHGMEALSHYQMSHGRAVAAGMCVVTRASVLAGTCSREREAELIALCKKFNLPTRSPYSVLAMYEIMTADKKRDGKKINLIVPNDKACDICSMELEQMKAFLLATEAVEQLCPRPGKRVCAVEVIPSKSVAHRFMIAQALSGNVPNIEEFSADMTATARCVDQLRSFLLGEQAESYPLACGESGSTLRFLLPVVGALGMPGDFYMEGRLPERPLTGLYEVLTEHGCTLLEQGSNPQSIRGKLRAGTYTLPGNISSQYVTGLLLALPLLEGESRIVIEGELQSKPYVDLTLSVMEQAGIVIEACADGYRIPGGQQYRMPENGKVEGDWSNAAFWLCLGAITDAEITCTGMKTDSRQGDRRVVDILRQFGANITIGDGERTRGRVTASKGELVATEFDATDIPDLVPILSLVAAVAKGTTHITGVGRLRIKESDRLEAIKTVLNSLGGKVEIKNEELYITGVEHLSGGMVDSFNDHRIAMMAAVASQVCEQPVTITRADAVKKSYPDFYRIFRQLLD